MVPSYCNQGLRIAKRRNRLGPKFLAGMDLATEPSVRLLSVNRRQTQLLEELVGEPNGVVGILAAYGVVRLTTKS